MQTRTTKDEWDKFVSDLPRMISEMPDIDKIAQEASKRGSTWMTPGDVELELGVQPRHWREFAAILRRGKRLSLEETLKFGLRLFSEGNDWSIRDRYKTYMTEPFGWGEITPKDWLYLGPEYLFFLHYNGYISVKSNILANLDQLSLADIAQIITRSLDEVILNSSEGFWRDVLDKRDEIIKRKKVACRTPEDSVRLIEEVSAIGSINDGESYHLLHECEEILLAVCEEYKGRLEQIKDNDISELENFVVPECLLPHCQIEETRQSLIRKWHEREQAERIHLAANAVARERQ